MFLKHFLRLSIIPSHLCRRSYYSNRINRLFLDNFDKYCAKLKTEEIPSEISHKAQSISKLLEKFTEFSANIKDVEKELESKQSDNELISLMKEEKVELEKKQSDLIPNVLNEIYEYELSKDKERISDVSCVLFEVSAGVGGKEAMLFANELCFMYLNYFNFKNWEVLDVESDEQAGYLRHYKAKVEGHDVWNFMKFEAGVHRVQRIPETETHGRIHTSTVSIACIPVTDDSAVEVDEKDLKFQAKKATGAGGQHVNTTESAIRVTHVPTGVSVECQEDRSQIKNRSIAIQKLRKILSDRYISETFEKNNKTRKSQVGRANRNEKIRTFNFNQDRVTDHRLSALSEESSDKEDTLHVLETFFNNPVRLDGFIEVLQRVEKERELLEIFEELKK